MGTTNSNYPVKLVVAAGAKFLQVVFCTVYSVWTASAIIDRYNASSKIFLKMWSKKLSTNCPKMSKKSDFYKCANSNVDPRMDSFCNNWSMPCFVFHPLHSTTSNHRKALLHCGQISSKIVQNYGILWSQTFFKLEFGIIVKYKTCRFSKNQMLSCKENLGCQFQKRYLLFLMIFVKASHTHWDFLPKFLSLHYYTTLKGVLGVQRSKQAQGTIVCLFGLLFFSQNGMAVKKRTKIINSQWKVTVFLGYFQSLLGYLGKTPSVP